MSASASSRQLSAVWQRQGIGNLSMSGISHRTIGISSLMSSVCRRISALMANGPISQYQRQWLRRNQLAPSGVSSLIGIINISGWPSAGSVADVISSVIGHLQYLSNDVMAQAYHHRSLSLVSMAC